jgi:Predicted ATP-dependent endonuclease of the OLD family
MYISELRISNFRCFDETEHIIQFKNGLSVLVGENDSGKSSILDAIRISLGTTDQSWYRVDIADFYKENDSLTIKITCVFSDLTDDEKAAFLECLTYTGSDATLIYNWSCRYLKGFRSPRALTEITSGMNGDGPAPASEARELLRTTYLRPLRDAYTNMQAGKGSRLSQILNGISDLNDGVKEYTETVELSKLSLTGIADLSNKLIESHSKIKSVNDSITATLADRMLLKKDTVSTEITVAGTNSSETRKLTALLEKLELTAMTIDEAGKVGLGTSNIMSMACELLLNKGNISTFLLIEEPEAHIHAQRQLRLMQSLEEEASKGNHQIIITTHSPLLASAVKLENIIIINKHAAYSLSNGKTQLSDDDYRFLERYLDATKANLFFAKGVIIVEGPSEELLFPTISRILGKDFSKHGISLVNSRGIGLNRFAGIFQRKDSDELLDVPVACVTDRDVMPDCAPAICLDEKYSSRAEWPPKRKWKTESDMTADEMQNHLQKVKERADGQNVKTFVSDHWTLEYDLAYAGLTDELLQAIILVKKGSEKLEKAFEEEKTFLDSFSTIEEKCSYVYSLVCSESKPEVAQALAGILEKKYSKNGVGLRKKLPQYIVSAIEYVAKE